MAYDHIYVIPDQGAMKGGLLFDKFTNLAYFADVDALVDKTQTGTDLAVSVKQHTRSRFMGDPAPSTVKASTRNISVNIRQTKGAIPGYTIGLSSGTENRQFQYTGSMSGLYAWLKTTALVQIDLTGPSGTPYDPIPAVSEGQAQTLRS